MTPDSNKIQSSQNKTISSIEVTEDLQDEKYSELDIWAIYEGFFTHYLFIVWLDID